MAANPQITTSTPGYATGETYNWVWEPTQGLWYDSNTFVTAPVGTPGPDQIGQYNGGPGDQGVYYNPTTKTLAFAGAGGQITGGVNPNDPTSQLNQKALAATAEKNATDSATADANAASADRDRQMQLANALDKTINDPNAPSVAHEQLNQALQANEATQLSQAAGASGENAFLARRGAARNTAALNAGAGQSAALLRAQEVAAAQSGLGTVLGATANEDISRYGTDTGAAGGYSNELLGANQKDTQIGLDQQNKNRDYWTQLGEKGATAVGSAIGAASDRRLKKDIDEEPDEKVMAFLSAVTPSSFKFKGEGDGQPDHHGVIAQDLEKSEIGRSLVHDTPGGKVIDVGGGIGAALAALAHLHGRVAKLEGKKGGKKRG